MWSLIHAGINVNSCWQRYPRSLFAVMKNCRILFDRLISQGDLDFEGNYRPISVIGHIARLVESLVCSQIIHYLESHDFISHDQSAYLKRHSTQTSLHRVIDDWLENINEGELTGACLLDISKCFDSINHDILLKKLEMYGFQDVELTWFKSYLYNRQQLVSFQQETSEYLDIKNGVPQGSVLGPILFLLFIKGKGNLCSKVTANAL